MREEEFLRFFVGDGVGRCLLISKALGWFDYWSVRVELKDCGDFELFFKRMWRMGIYGWVVMM